MTTHLTKNARPERMEMATHLGLAAMTMTKNALAPPARTQSKWLAATTSPKYQMTNLPDSNLNFNLAHLGIWMCQYIACF